VYQHGRATLAVSDRRFADSKTLKGGTN